MTAYITYGSLLFGYLGDFAAFVQASKKTARFRPGAT